MECETNDCRKEKRGCKGCAYENMNNIDEDTKILKDFTKVEFIMTDRKEITKLAHKEISQAIDNVLKELEQLQEDIKEHEKTSFEFQEENIKLKKELETYKKIAEKLAEVVDLGYMPFECSPMCIHDNCIKECALDWARKEVEND